MSNYLKYTGTKPDHAVGVVAPGSDPDNPSAGQVSQTVFAQPGSVVALDPAIAAAVLDREPNLWQPVAGFGD